MQIASKTPNCEHKFMRYFMKILANQQNTILMFLYSRAYAILSRLIESTEPLLFAWRQRALKAIMKYDDMKEKRRRLTINSCALCRMNVWTDNAQEFDTQKRHVMNCGRWWLDMRHTGSPHARDDHTTTTNNDGTHQWRNYRLAKLWMSMNQDERFWRWSENMLIAPSTTLWLKRRSRFLVRQKPNKEEKKRNNMQYIVKSTWIKCR